MEKFRATMDEGLFESSPAFVLLKFSQETPDRAERPIQVYRITKYLAKSYSVYQEKFLEGNHLNTGLTYNSHLPVRPKKLRLYG